MVTRKPSRQVPLPEGFVYRPEFITAQEEAALLDAIRAIPFSAVVMHGVTARRRVAHFGWLYNFESFHVSPGPPVPDFLLPLRERAARVAEVEPEQLAETLITEYPVGATIGWHRDAPPFGIVVGISLLGSCRLRLRREGQMERELAEVFVEPRSAYVFSGEARTRWQHHIPPTRQPRYSITFRTLRKPRD